MDMCYWNNVEVAPVLWKHPLSLSKSSKKLLIVLPKNKSYRFGDIFITNTNP